MRCFLFLLRLSKPSCNVLQVVQVADRCVRQAFSRVQAKSSLTKRNTAGDLGLRYLPEKASKTCRGSRPCHYRTSTIARHLCHWRRPQSAFSPPSNLSHLFPYFYSHSLIQTVSENLLDDSEAWSHLHLVDTWDPLHNLSN